MVTPADEYEEVIKLPWIHTPLVESKSLSEAAGCTVLMKLDLHQPSGSFKSRGVGGFILYRTQPLDPNAALPHIYISGVNAGLAAAIASTSRGCTCTVVVPDSTALPMIRKIQKAGATVIQHGATWAEADAHIREIMATATPGGRESIYCPPFDHQDIWLANATLITEALTDLAGEPPKAVIASVGGGGLFCGIQLGLMANRLPHVPVIAVETRGADSLSQSLHAGRNTTLLEITSIATSLGARRVADKAFELAQRPNVRSVVVEDAQAGRACVRFAEEERMLVEAACGASLSVCYEGILRKVLPELRKEDKVVVIVCGGNNISLSMLEEYRKVYGAPEVDRMAAMHLD